MPAGPSGPRARPSAGQAYASAMREAGPLLGLGIQIMFAMAFFAGVGYAVDRWLGWSPWGLIAGCLLGVVAVFALLFRVVGQLNERTAARQRKAPPAEPGGDGAGATA